MMDRTTAQSEPEIDYRRLRLRDNEEVVRWFDTYSDPVYGFIFYRVGRDADLAGDVAQETFVTALETIDRFDPRRGEMFSWLTHIARNCIRKSCAEKAGTALCRLLEYRRSSTHQSSSRPEFKYSARGTIREEGDRRVGAHGPDQSAVALSGDSAQALL